MFNCVHYLKRKSFFLWACLAFFCFTNYAMETDTELEPLLNSYDLETEEVSRSFSFEAFKQFSEINPEITANIFSFLPGNDLGLNFLIRFDGFQPKTDPIEISPFYQIVKTITCAYYQYIFKKCQECLKDPAYVAYIMEKKIAKSMLRFMHTTQYESTSETSKKYGTKR